MSRGRFLVRRILFLAIFCLLAHFGICGAASPIPGELKEDATSIKLGDPIENALKFFGPPTVITANGENYCWRNRINLIGPELIIKTKYGKNIWSIVVDKLPMVRTPEGIGIGSKQEEIEAKYGKGKGYTDVNGDIIIGYGEENAKDPFMRFRLSGRKEKTVVYMVIGNPDVGASSSSAKDKKGKKGKKGKKKK